MCPVIFVVGVVVGVVGVYARPKVVAYIKAKYAAYKAK